MANVLLRSLGQSLNTNLEAQHAGVEVLHHGVEVAVGHVREEDGQLLLDPALPAAAAQAEGEVG